MVELQHPTLRSRCFRDCSATRLNISWMAVVLPTKHTAIFKPFGGISHTPHFMLFGIHSMKYLGRVARERRSAKFLPEK